MTYHMTLALACRYGVDQSAHCRDTTIGDHTREWTGCPFFIAPWVSSRRISVPWSRLRRSTIACAGKDQGKCPWPHTDQAGELYVGELVFPTDGTIQFENLAATTLLEGATGTPAHFIAGQVSDDQVVCCKWLTVDVAGD